MSESSLTEFSAQIAVLGKSGDPASDRVDVLRVDQQGCITSNPAKAPFDEVRTGVANVIGATGAGLDPMSAE